MYGWYDSVTLVHELHQLHQKLRWSGWDNKKSVSDDIYYEYTLVRPEITYR